MPIVDEVTRTELELIRAKVRRSMDAAARGEIMEVDDAFMDDLFRRAEKRDTQPATSRDA